MTEPIGSPVDSQPVGSVCPKCGKVHNPRKCKGHKRDGEGWKQCGAWPITNLPVCGAHGGHAPRSRVAAEGRAVEVKVRKTLGRLTSQPVENPLEELLALAGEAKAWRLLLAEHVAELQRLRYSTEGGEHIRGEVTLFERAMAECRKVLVDVARLDIDARLASISERHIGVALQLVDAILRRRGIDPDSAEVRADKVAEIAALTGGRAIEGTVAA